MSAKLARSRLPCANRILTRQRSVAHTPAEVDAPRRRAGDRWHRPRRRVARRYVALTATSWGAGANSCKRGIGTSRTVIGDRTGRYRTRVSGHRPRARLRPSSAPSGRNGCAESEGYLTSGIGDRCRSGMRTVWPSARRTGLLARRSSGAPSRRRAGGTAAVGRPPRALSESVLP